MDEKKETNITADSFAKETLNFLSYFNCVFDNDHSYTKVIMKDFLSETDKSFIDKLAVYENWQNRDLLLESYHRLIGFIKKHPELLEKLDEENQYHHVFAENCHLFESK